MKTKVLGIVKGLARQLLPASLRRRIWDRFAERYFERSSLLAIVKYASTNKKSEAKQIAKLIMMLEKNGYRADFALIKAELGLEFKAFSNQDLIAFLYFSGKSAGFYVDIGAFDGVQISNTYALEKIGWDGVCIEPIPEIFSLLETNRNSHMYNVAISSEAKHEVNFSKVPRSLGLSGLEHQMPERIRKGLENQELKIENITVNTMTFDDVMKHHSEIKYVDFLSIDVEGGEIDVLDSIDFERYRFGLITIENNAGTAKLAKYMNRHGYVIFLDLGVDLMFIPSRINACLASE